MTRYRIVCTEQSPPNEPHDTAHIVAVGIGTDPKAADTKWTLKDVFAALDRSDSFYTKGTTSGKEASVHKYACKTCGFATIRSGADRVEDNNLDNLRACSWKA